LVVIPPSSTNGGDGGGAVEDGDDDDSQWTSTESETEPMATARKLVIRRIFRLLVALE